MKFIELVKLLLQNGFKLIKEKGSVRYYHKPGCLNLIRVDYHGSKEIPSGTCNAILKAAGLKKPGGNMLDIEYSLIIETTEEPDFFTFFSPDLEGFTGVGHSIEDCIYNARHAMREHVKLLIENQLPVTPKNEDPKITIQNSFNIAA